MRMRRLLVAVLVGTALGAPACASDHDKQLARVAGTVQYQLAAAEPFRPIFGRVDLPDEAVAVTLAQSRANVRLADSSEIDVGANTRVRMGAFNATDATDPRVVYLDLGTIHFTVRHPAGGRSNYRFVTPTSSIAVRGTDGYLVTGPTGTDFYCVACEPGDVTITVGNRSYALATGQQAIVFGTGAADAAVAVVNLPCTNPAAVDLSDGKLGRGVPRSEQTDTTGALGGDPLKAVPVRP